MIHMQTCALAGARIVSARRTRHRFVPHAHDFTVIGVFTEGAQISRYGLRELDVACGDVVLVPPGEIHDGRPSGGISDARPRSYLMAYLDESALGTLAESCGLERTAADGFFQKVLTRGDSRTSHAVKALIAALMSSTGRDGLDDRTVDTFGALMRETRPYSGPESPACPDLARRIRTRLDDTGTPLSQIADALDISRFALLRCFRKQFGITPSQYRRHRRVQTACTLMGKSAPLTDIAFEAGFADQSHFIRDFRAVYGVTPGAFRSAAA